MLEQNRWNGIKYIKHGFHVFAPFQPLLWAVLHSAASTGSQYITSLGAADASNLGPHCEASLTRLGLTVQLLSWPISAKSEYREPQSQVKSLPLLGPRFKNQTAKVIYDLVKRNIAQEL
jgi:hypothetical protein